MGIVSSPLMIFIGEAVLEEIWLMFQIVTILLKQMAKKPLCSQ